MRLEHNVLGNTTLENSSTHSNLRQSRHTRNSSRKIPEKASTNLEIASAANKSEVCSNGCRRRRNSAYCEERTRPQVGDPGHTQGKKALYRWSSCARPTIHARARLYTPVSAQHDASTRVFLKPWSFTARSTSVYSVIFIEFITSPVLTLKQIVQPQKL